jgi:serine protease inhibitor
VEDRANTKGLVSSFQLIFTRCGQVCAFRRRMPPSSAQVSSSPKIQVQLSGTNDGRRSFVAYSRAHTGPSRRTTRLRAAVALLALFVACLGFRTYLSQRQPMSVSSSETWRQKIAANLPSWMSGSAERTSPVNSEDVRNANAFAVALFGKVADGKPDVFLSPLSVATSLAMLLAGASIGGPVERELNAVLKTSGADIAALQAGLSAGTDGAKVKILSANSLWIKSTINADFKSHVSKEFQAEVKPLSTEPEPINKWVNDATDGMIPVLMDRIPAQAVALLVNAVFFKGAWTHAFNPSQTKADTPFRQPGGAGEKLVKMMVMRNQNFRFGEAPLPRGSLKMVELPYGDSAKYTAVVVLPEDEATLSDAVASIGDWDKWIGKLSAEPVKVDYLGMPRFKLEYGASSLKPALEALGLKSAWTPDPAAAKFDRMTDDPQVALDDVVHKAAVEVTEEGTKASAATGAVMTPKSFNALQDSRMIYVDAPFLFAIRNRESGLIVFLGRVDDPK